jgi:hypothetical protein
VLAKQKRIKATGDPELIARAMTPAGNISSPGCQCGASKPRRTKRRWPERAFAIIGNWWLNFNDYLKFQEHH